jgi:hypothetical protein
VPAVRGDPAATGQRVPASADDRIAVVKRRSSKSVSAGSWRGRRATAMSIAAVVQALQSSSGDC